MGCDGGTIPKRDELVRTKKKPEQKDKNSELSFRWGHCAISQEPLQKPIVACQLGRLYNKVAVIMAMLDKSSLPETSNHIKNIKDVKELVLTSNPAFEKKAKAGDAYDDLVSPYVCPVIGLEMNGKFKFVYLWTCGCTLSERALKAITTTAKICVKCQQPYTEEDIIVLNGSEEEVEGLRVKMEARQARAKAEKKAKKEKKNGDISTESSTISTAVLTTTDQPGPSTSKGLSKLAVKRPINTNKIQDPVFKKTKADYSVAKDPKATEVFKSLFTSHKTASEQTKAHWITYNPFYN